MFNWCVGFYFFLCEKRNNADKYDSKSERMNNMQRYTLCTKPILLADICDLSLS